jgi:hypothetical protein
MSLFKEIIRRFNKEKIRYLLIGRQAVMFYGAPLFSFDYDFWIHPEDKSKTYQILEERLDLEPSYPIESKRPIVSFLSISGEKIDVFFVRKITNKDGETFDIDEVLRRSIMVKDKNFAIRLPHIDDLIGLKKIGERPKDLEDIEYLKALKKELKIY